MTFRFFSCSDCGHRMRLSRATCGRCNEDKKPHQRIVFWVVPLILALAAVGGILFG